MGKKLSPGLYVDKGGARVRFRFPGGLMADITGKRGAVRKNVDELLIEWLDIARHGGLNEFADDIEKTWNDWKAANPAP